MTSNTSEYNKKYYFKNKLKYADYYAKNKDKINEKRKKRWYYFTFQGKTFRFNSKNELMKHIHTNLK